jgi:hypothetical protein
MNSAANPDLISAFYRFEVGDPGTGGPGHLVDDAMAAFVRRAPYFVKFLQPDIHKRRNTFVVGRTALSRVRKKAEIVAKRLCILATA